MLPKVNSPRPPKAEGPSSVPAVTRAIAVIRHLNCRPGAGVSELAAALQLTKSHCFNILKTLQSEGWIDYDKERRLYRLSGQMLNDCFSVMVAPSRLAAVHDELVRLTQGIRVGSLLTIVDAEGSFIAFDKTEIPNELLVSVPLGHRFPPDAPAQMRVRLAWAARAEQSEALRQWRPTQYTPSTIVDKRRVAREIRLTRERGYAISYAEFTPGIMTLAAPILDAEQRVLYILQCPGLEADMINRQSEIAAGLLKTVKRIALFLNYGSSAGAGES
jgi:DNA-binding IclR family transcriptional regulator